MKTPTIRKTATECGPKPSHPNSQNKDIVVEYLEKLDDSLNIRGDILKTDVERLTYQRIYREIHRDEYRTYSRKYYNDHKVKLKKARRLRYEKNRLVERIAWAKYYRKNSPRINHVAREYYAANRDTIKEKSHQYYLKNRATTTPTLKKSEKIPLGSTTVHRKQYGAADDVQINILKKQHDLSIGIGKNPVHHSSHRQRKPLLGVQTK